MIPTVTVSADNNLEYSTNPGKATKDQVFLLSIAEANEYFSSNSARQCKPTDYAVANGASVDSDNGNCFWWLRSPGARQAYAAGIYSGGGIGEYGNYVNIDGGAMQYGYDFFTDCDAVRPAMWINLY